MKLDSFQEIIHVLNKSNIRYILSNQSLVGYSEGNIHKYTHHVHFSIFSHNLYRMIIFTFRCLLKGITIITYFFTVPIILPGTPSTIELSGTSFITVDPTDIIQFLPILTPVEILAPIPTTV